MTGREWLQTIVDRLPETALDEAAQRLASLLRREDDPLIYALANAPLDDEPLTDEDLAALSEAREEIARGETISWEEIKSARVRSA